MTKSVAGAWRNIVLAMLFASSVALAAPASSTTVSIGQLGGEVKLGAARINIPAGVFSKPTLVRFEQLARPPLPVPAPYRVVAVYRMISDKVANFVPIRILLPALARDAAYLDEVYEIENGDYVIASIGGYELYTDPSPLRGPAAPLNSVYVITRVLKQSVINSLAATGGEFNGYYGSCPEGTGEYFGKCREFKDSP
jgi:hypothetical protein